VARYSNPLREAGGQLPGDGGHSFTDDVVVLMSRQTRPSRASVLATGLDAIAEDTADDLEAALEQLAAVAADLRSDRS
jgi:hypothetical protein